MDYDDYDEFTITALRSKADERGLPVTGLKVDLIARLQDDDRRKYNNRLHSGAFKDRGMLSHKMSLIVLLVALSRPTIRGSLLTV